MSRTSNTSKGSGAQSKAAGSPVLLAEQPTRSKREVIGPGWWMNDHTTTAQIYSAEEEDAFIKAYEKRLRAFPCASCRKHALKYLQEHDINNYRRITDHGRYIGMFLYVWEFHNSVNKRIGRSIMQRDVAIAKYMGAKACTTC